MKRKISLKNLSGLVLTSTGLNEAQVAKQRAKFGPNEVVERIGNPWLELLADTVRDPMVWFLVAIAFIFYFIGDVNEAVILSVATLPIIFMDAFLHWRTQASTATLRGQLSSKVLVIRSGRELEIESHDLVPGDLVALSTKNHFAPADGIWEKVDCLQVDESVLTGEAFPVSKSSMLLESKGDTQQEIYGESNVLGFAGTRVLTGNGYLRVLSTGKHTSYGEIVQSVAKINHERTPLQSAILDLTRFLIYASLIFCLALAGIRYYQGHGWLDALLSAAVLAVAAIPEEFPVVFSFYLGVGVFRLAKRHALVRRAVSVENIGRVTQICTDKTGTLTMGQLKLTHLDVSDSFSEEDILLMAQTASNPKGSDPIDLAIISTSHGRNIQALARDSVIPFTEDRKRETVFTIRDGIKMCVVKGSPEVVLSMSNVTNVELANWLKHVSKFAQGGHKVLAVACVSTTDDIEPSTGFDFYGLLAFEDPPRPEVKKAIEYCRKSEIKVMMITGDHPETAAAIAKDVGLITDNNSIIVSAQDEAYKLEEEWIHKNIDYFKSVDVVARCNPLQKLRIVEALKKSGELVVVTGDGVNDVPALKAADIGVAMGLRGSRSAKEVSSIILADDNFSTIANAILEGRQLFKNLRMSFYYLLLFHIPFVLSAAIIPLLGYPLLYLPIHVVWLELIIHPTALFAFQQYSKNEVKSTTIYQKSFFSKLDTVIILSISLCLTAVLIWAFAVGVSEDQDIGHGRAVAMALLSTWSGGIVLILTKGATLTAKFIVAATLIGPFILIQSKWAAKIFHLTPLHSVDWLKIFATITVFLILLFISQKYKKDTN